MATIATKNDLKSNTRATSIDVLNARLADAIDLALQYQPSAVALDIVVGAWTRNIPSPPSCFIPPRLFPLRFFLNFASC